MVYLALSVVALSISFYVISYGRPITLGLYGWGKPEATPRKVGAATRSGKDGDCEKEEYTNGSEQLRKELQDTQDNAGQGRYMLPQTTPRAQSQNAEAPGSIPSFALDGPGDEPPKPAGRLRIDRSSQSPIPSSPRSPRSQQQPALTNTMPPPSRSSPKSRQKPDMSRSSPTLPSPRIISTPSTSLMPPPSRPSRPSSSSTLLPPPSAASALRIPPASSSLAPTSSSLPTSSRPSKKVLLSPGHSPLDWAALVASPPNQTFLRGSSLPPHLIKVPPSMLKYHNGRKDPATGKVKDAWGVWAGRVYNMTPYLDFHPGGRGEMLRGAGKEEAVMRKLFEEVHPWVSWEGMLGRCLVGILVSEGDEGESRMDEMD